VRRAVEISQRGNGYERFWPDCEARALDVTPEKATVTFINVEGKTLHTFSVLPA
jgi:hypothetical protein